MKSVLKSLLPPVLVDGLRKIRGWENQVRFSGDYGSWAEALRNSRGYDAHEILAATHRAMVKIRNGEAVFERDSVLLDRPEPPFPLICGLLRAASRSSGRLSVLDFGGALGSTYYQCRRFLDTVPQVRWSVVEQPAHVACGQAEFSSEHLRFYSSIEECLANERPNVLVLSCVLQYLPAPHEFLQGILGHRIPALIVDRVAFLAEDRDRLTVQQVPDNIYPASYPAWFFSRSRFLKQFSSGYTLIHGFPGTDRVQLDQGESFFEGFVFDVNS